MTNNDLIIYDEISKIYADAVLGKMENLVKQDVEAYNVKLGTWGTSTHNYKDCVKLYASSRGWTQEGFDEMEVIEPFWDWVEDPQ
jgi:hypothetical protein